MDFYDAFTELNALAEDNFIDDTDREVFLEYLNNPSSILMEMANVRGCDVSIIDKFPFSFYFSTKSAVHNQHGIRAKILWNASKMPKDADGYLELQDEYNYVSGSHKYKPMAKELNYAKAFFKKYKVLFAAVWEEILYEEYLRDYFNGNLSFKKLLSKIEIDPDDPESINYYNINHCNSIEELEELARKDKLWNMND